MYGVFADYYDALIDVDYAKKADYICGIFRRAEHEPGETLDLACGTGSLTIELKKRGIDVFGADMSEEMLTRAQSKADEAGLDIMFVRQKMQSLSLWGQIDSCVCTLDSISHLQGESYVRRAFSRIAANMRSGGLFVFDVNTPYKHKNILGERTYVYDTEEVFLVWQNEYRGSDCSVKIDLDFFVPRSGLFAREHESFREFAYPLGDIEKMLGDSGFEVLFMFDDFSFDPPREDSQRLTIAARKK